MHLRKLTAEEVHFEVTTEPEDIPVEGNYMWTDDAEADKQAEREIRDRLERGDDSAWCCLVVEARWKIHSAKAYLGGCSFTEGNTFEESMAEVSDYLEDLRSEALDVLNAKIQAKFAELSELASEGAES